MIAAIWQIGIRALALAAFLALAGAPARAATILRDPDIEHALRQLALPLVEAAQLPTDVRVLVVGDSKLNAFIIDSKTIFLHSGLILAAGSAAELQAVLAHEIAHIANGHIARRTSNRRQSSAGALFGLMVAAAVGTGTGNADAAVGIAAGSKGTADRIFFSHTRAEEASADQAALRYLARIGVDPAAMADLLRRLDGKEYLSTGRRSPYMRSHPPTRDRIRAVDEFAAARAGGPAGDGEADYWFARAQAKLGAFLREPRRTLERVGPSGGADIAVMGRAIALHRLPDGDRAVAEIDRLAETLPEDPFVHELRGQILLETGNDAAAVDAYRRAADLAPDNALILAGYGRALLRLGTAEGDATALDILIDARSQDARDVRMMRDLAIAYARDGQDGMASLVTAERHALVGDLETAAVHAKRAVDALPRGSLGWNRAQDVLTAAGAD